MWLFAFVAHAEVAVPPVARVTDLTSTLDATQRSALEHKLATFEQTKGSQIALLIVPTTQPETIEQYSIRVTDAWKLGRKGVDDGILITVARNDRTIRIEVGYGLEGVVPDAIANRIIDETILPRFKAGDYYGGLDAGITQLIGVIGGEPLPPVANPDQARDQRVGNYMPLLFIALGGAQLLRRLFGRAIGGVAAGGAVFVIAWLVSGVLPIALFFGIAALLLSLLGLGGVGFGGGFGGGGGSSGGGGFSGGGGGFGGGGASGRW